MPAGQKAWGGSMSSQVEGTVTDGRISLPDRSWLQAGCLALALLFLAFVWIQPWYEARWMFTDALTAASLADACCKSWYGAISMLGIMGWITTAAVCVFAAAVLAMFGGGREPALFLLGAGTLSAILGFDDAYMLHEWVLPRHGIHQTAVMAVPGLLAVLYAVRFRRKLLQHDAWLLALGAGALAGSIAVDQILHSIAPLAIFVEDGLKFFGIVCWVVFHVFAAIAEVGALLEKSGRQVRT